MTLEEYLEKESRAKRQIQSIRDGVEENRRAYEQSCNEKLARRGITKGTLVKWSFSSGYFNRVEVQFHRGFPFFHIVYNYSTPTGRISKKEGRDSLLGLDEKALYNIKIIRG